MAHILALRTPAVWLGGKFKMRSMLIYWHIFYNILIPYKK